jgi:CRISPR-associated endonuclease/helicase Cas3
MGDYFKYWGKAKADDESGPAFHLLPYHCLDVAAVGYEWWQQSKVIRKHFEAESGLSETEAFAWVVFFIVLHDLGKFDVRFQLKAQDVALHLWPEFANADCGSRYWHGEYSSYWAFKDLDERFSWGDEWSGEEKWDAWMPWIFSVAGHHGVIQPDIYGLKAPQGDPHVLEHDKAARLAFINEMETLFLKPAGLSLDNAPPSVDQDFLAGFCSICDWLGSMEINGVGEPRFYYVDQVMPLNDYFVSRSDAAKQVLQESGLFHAAGTDGGMAALFSQYTPRLVQTLVDDLPVQSGLTIIEAPTGSGKTEAALAYASRLLAEGVAESIIFALPTQATANAMFDRLLEVTEKLYHNSNLLLAHGKARFNEQFMDLKGIASKRSPQDSRHETEAAVQCSEWLSQSRKRVFLGQVGVCTIDQVLISVLPVKHKFVRSFGLGKSVLIVDEVHAYDSYMYGLLEGVLKKQKQLHGSAILLSATLPHHQKESLVSAWGGLLDEQMDEEPYPLITHLSQTLPAYFELPESEQTTLEQTARQVQVNIVESPDMQFDDDLLDQVVQAAKAGANVVLICNLVADAQNTAGRLRERGGMSVDIFHSRFRFADRQRKEKAVMKDYGNGNQRKQGGILVATQVVEQSLDLDFDWMLTQLCPVDLLFQRLGRLHRHERIRPRGFESPRCSVIVPTNQDYALHKLIYGDAEAPNSRVLWRTEQLLRQQALLRFPEVYRPMIERVYQDDAWQDEPENIQQEHIDFQNAQIATKSNAWRLMNANPNFEDSDSRVALLTRDGEMSLNVVPVIGYGRKKEFLDGQRVSDIDEWKLLEFLSMNTVPVPASWKRKGLPDEKDGVTWLPMEQQPDQSWVYINDKMALTYTVERGLERKER